MLLKFILFFGFPATVFAGGFVKGGQSYNCQQAFDPEEEKDSYYHYFKAKKEGKQQEFIKALAARGGPFAGIMRDEMLIEAIAKHNDNIVGIMLDSPALEAELLQKIFKKNSKLIIYDADVYPNSLLFSILGENAIGVSVRKDYHFYRDIYVVENIENKRRIFAIINSHLMNPYLFSDVISVGQKEYGAHFLGHFRTHLQEAKKDQAQLYLNRAGVVKVLADSSDLDFLHADPAKPMLTRQELVDPSFFQKKFSLQDWLVEHVLFGMRRASEGYRFSDEADPVSILYAYYNPSSTLILFPGYRKAEFWKKLQQYYDLSNPLLHEEDPRIFKTPPIAAPETHKTAPAIVKPEPAKSDPAKPAPVARRSLDLISEEKQEKILKKLESEKSPFRQHLSDFLIYSWLKDLSRKYKTIHVQVGHAFEKNTPHAAEEVMEKVVAELVKNNIQIVYDYDSYLGEKIKTWSGHLGVGVSAQHSEDGKVVKIGNDYLRLELFSHATHLIMSSDSVAAMGTLLESTGSEIAVFDLGQKWKHGFKEWGRFPAEGVPSYLRFGVLSSIWEISNEAAGLIKFINSRRFSGKAKTAAEVFVPKDFLKCLSQSEYNIIVANAKNLAYLGMDSAKTAEEMGNAHLDGVVVFGSAGGALRYESLVYNASQVLGQAGVTGATGGAGGYMRVANSAFYAEGARSIGVPISGNFLNLANEKRFFYEGQTLSLASSGYESRIPLLIGQRKFLIAAPGSSGTMKEVATAFYTLASEAEGNRQLIFLSKEFYQGAHEWLQQLKGHHFPQNVLDRIKIVDSPEDMKTLLDAYLATLSADERAKFIAIPNPQKRESKPFFFQKDQSKKSDDDWSL